MKIFLRTLIVCLIVYGVWYVKSAYFETSYTSKILPEQNTKTEEKTSEPKKPDNKEKVKKVVSVYFMDKDGNFAVSRRESTSVSLEFAIKQLLAGPLEKEKKSGWYSEIPSDTRLLSITNAKDKVVINLSSDFERGGGTESITNRIRQLAKTANENAGNKQIFLFIDGKQAEVLGGEGVMIEQPLRD